MSNIFSFVNRLRWLVEKFFRLQNTKSIPAPVAHANINTAQRITDVMPDTLAQAVPHRVTAAGTGSMSNFTIGGRDAGR